VVNPRFVLDHEAKTAIREISMKPTLAALLLGSTLAAPAMSEAAPSGMTARPAARGPAITTQQLNVADGSADWLSYGHGPGEQRYSPLTRINASNASRLGLSWYADLDTARGQEATPLEVGGVLYTTTAWSMVKAFDGKTGALLWSFDPGVHRERGVDACCDVVNRGVAILGDLVFVGTLDGRLIALHAGNGKPAWSVQTTDPTKHYTITMAPRVANGLVLIGNGGGEYGMRGYISAYDAASGKLAWRFYTVPGQPGHPDHAASDTALAKAAKSWSGDWWKFGGGGNVWDAVGFDPQLDLVYFGTSNAAPWNQKYLSPNGGDTLFTASIVAVNAKTGAYVWHYQTTPGESWDFDATQQLVQADLKIDGKITPVLMQANKNGFFYVLNRKTGALISAKNFAPVSWATSIDMKTGRPVENPDARYYKSGKPFVVMPSAYGAHNWQPMAYSPATGLAYIPEQEVPSPYVGKTDYAPSKVGWQTGINFAAMALPNVPAIKQAVLSVLKGALVAWDPVAGREVWRAQHAGPWNGGVLATAGDIVVQGTAAGQVEIYNASTGQKLWSAPAETGVIAAPMTYAIDGVQYIAVMAGWGGAFPLAAGELAYKSGRVDNVSRLLVFALDGTKQLPPHVVAEDAPLSPPANLGVGPGVVAAGMALYADHCGVCHGGGAVNGSGGAIPDLRHSATLADGGTFHSVVLGGALASGGMASFKGELDDAQVDAVRAYLISRANEDKRAEGAPSPVVPAREPARKG